MSAIIRAVFKGLWKSLQLFYLPIPIDDPWKQTEIGYKEFWNFPKYIGRIDCKHVFIKWPPKNT